MTHFCTFGTVTPVDLIFCCLGKPLPTVSWFVNDRLVDGRVDTNDHRVTINKLEIHGVQRSHLNSTYKCQASNTNLVLPTQKTVRLELIREFFRGFFLLFFILKRKKKIIFIRFYVAL